MTLLALLYGFAAFAVSGYVIGQLLNEDVHAGVAFAIGLTVGAAWPPILLLICLGYLASKFDR